MAYHHFAEPAKVTQALSRFLRPGGVLLIADWQPETDESAEGKDVRKVPGPPEGVPEGVVAHHHGYTESTMKSLYEAGGLTLENYLTDVGEFDMKGKICHVFVSKGVKKE
jgi:SAM-dependent methyltransferase